MNRLQYQSSRKKKRRLDEYYEMYPIEPVHIDSPPDEEQFKHVEEDEL